MRESVIGIDAGIGVVGFVKGVGRIARYTMNDSHTHGLGDSFRLT